MFLREVQTAPSFSSNPRPVCISTPISVLQEQLTASTLSIVFVLFPSSDIL